MVSYNLECHREHDFEGWFPSRQDYDAQMTKQLVSCPYCDSTDITQIASAPNIKTNKSQPNKTQILSMMRQYVEESSENVGNGFASAARDMHYGDTEARNIYGTATEQEIKSLNDEEIPYSMLPWKHTKEEQH